MTAKEIEKMTNEELYRVSQAIDSIETLKEILYEVLNRNGEEPINNDAVAWYDPFFDEEVEDTLSKRMGMYDEEEEYPTSEYFSAGLAEKEKALNEEEKREYVAYIRSAIGNTIDDINGLLR